MVRRPEMKGNFKPSISGALALELHSDQPERLVKFYEETLGIKFFLQGYPFNRYFASLGRFALIIGEAQGRDADTASEPGKVTLALMSTQEIPGGNRRFFLPPPRPLGIGVPERLAARLRDPDGNYVALATSLEHVVGVLPAFSLGELFSSGKELFLIVMTQLACNIRRFMENAIDRCEMITNGVTFLKKDLRGYTHFVAAQNGLYAVNSTSYCRLLRGKFYGLTIKDGDLFAYQAMGEGEAIANRNGRILRLTIRNNRIERIKVVAKDLDSGCHQIDFVGDDLLIVDSYNGCIVRMRIEAPEERKVYYPLGKVTRAIAKDTYHINSIAGHPDGTVWVLLHNSGHKRSEVIVLDQDFEVCRRFSVDAGWAHNIVFTNDRLEYLISDSLGGRVISPNGAVIDGGVGKLMIRGLSLDEDTCVVGDSIFGSRPFRRFVPGHVYFYGRHSWELRSILSVPGAPTDIRRIDGKDFSLSNYFAAHTQATGLYSPGRREVEPVEPVSA